MNYEKDIVIDESALDVEWLEQPRMMLKYTRHAAEMKMDMDAAKERLDFTRAELDAAIRSDPDKFDMEKITEGAVTNCIIIQPTYKRAVDAFNTAKYEYEVAVGAVRAFDQRKSALEALVKLHGQQYFAGPSVPRDLSKEWEQRQGQKSADRKVKISRNK